MADKKPKNGGREADKRLFARFFLFSRVFDGV